MGWTSSELKYDNEAQMWTMGSLDLEEGPYAFYNLTDEYPFGKRTWTVVGEQCFNKESTEVTLQVRWTLIRMHHVCTLLTAIYFG